MATDIEALAAWCVDRCERLSDVMGSHIIEEGGNLADPEYRMILGEYTAYMKVRSHISRMMKENRRAD